MTMRGTHQEESAGIEPTRQQVEIAWMQIDHIFGGDQEKVWANWDLMGPLRQIGASLPRAEAIRGLAANRDAPIGTPPEAYAEFAGVRINEYRRNNSLSAE